MFAERSVRSTRLALAAALLCAGCSGSYDPGPTTPARPDSGLDDREAIRDLMDRASDAINHQDWTLLGTMLSDDAVWEALPPIQWRLEGRAAIVAFLTRNVSVVEVLAYDLHSVAIRLDGPDRASARSSMSELLRLKETERGLQVVGTYSDRFIKTGAGWRFAARTFQVRYEDDVALPERLHGAGGSNAPRAGTAPPDDR